MEIYTPYFISKSTLMENEGSDKEPKKISIMDILQNHIFLKRVQSKYIVRVNLNEEYKITNLSQGGESSISSYNRPEPYLFENENNSKGVLKRLPEIDEAPSNKEVDNGSTNKFEKSYFS
jgi:hypothetical protein